MDTCTASSRRETPLPPFLPKHLLHALLLLCLPRPHATFIPTTAWLLTIVRALTLNCLFARHNYPGWKHTLDNWR